jgi:hypothetical protein
MTLEYGPVTSRGKSAPGPDPRIKHRIQIVMFRPIRVDHTNCLQVDIKTHSFTSMDVDPSSVNGETELNAYMRVKQVTKDTDPLMWWKQHQQEFPHLTHMT